MPKRYLVTGGTGFLGRSLVRALVARGDEVRSLDDDSRGSKALLSDLGQVECITADIRDLAAVKEATKNIDCVCHLAYINGTQTFYEKPVQILDIATKGMLNVLEACIENKVPELALASSPEAYQTASIIPTDETVGLSVPDPLNARFSYGGGKIICELLAINYGREYFDKVTIFRPHSVYGPKMGNAHVIPQLVSRIKPLISSDPVVKLPIQGDGSETRSFCYIDDCIEGILITMDQGAHLGIYHIGNEEEVTIAQLAQKIGAIFGKSVRVIPGPLQPGSTHRRCPSIKKLRTLGYEPKTSLDRGLRITIEQSVEVPV